MDIRKSDTAVVFIDPQNDVLSEKGANWGAVGASVTENRTVENMERIFKAAESVGSQTRRSATIGAGSAQIKIASTGVAARTNASAPV